MNNLSELAAGPLFEGILPGEREQLLACLDPQRHEYPGGGPILLAGDRIGGMGLVVRGGARILLEDINGNDNLLARVEPGEVFAEVLACLELPHSPVTVMAEPGTTVALFDYKRIVTGCPGACAFHSRLVSNLMAIMARKNMQLQMKVNCVGHRTTREKVETYLAFQHEQAGTNPFLIPLSRAEMARYLCVDRSALSAVLGGMQREGLIRFKRNEFELLGLRQLQ